MINNKIKKSFFWALLVLLLLFILAYPFRHRIKNSVIYYYGILKSRINQDGGAKCEGCDVLFVDGIAAHETAYQKEKINEQQTDDGLLQLEEKNILQKIESNDFYIVRKLDHSKPLLLPKAVTFLSLLSDSYHQDCEANNLTYIPFEITSVTRSVQSVEKLMNENSNSIKKSAHLHGKTFDVSYRAFTGNKSQLNLFVQTLSKFKSEDKCFVKYEKNGCLHITVN